MPAVRHNEYRPMKIHKDIKKWFLKEYTFEDLDFEAVSSALLHSLETNRFRRTTLSNTNGLLNTQAILGSKFAAFCAHQLPFGNHWSTGKRLFLKASVANRGSVKVNIQITPYMELINLEEEMLISQSIPEKFSDELFAVKILHNVVQGMYALLNLPAPDDIKNFKSKDLHKDILLSILIYPFDSSASSKPIYSPNSKGPFWSWGGFLIPELWFVWHEIWGVSIIALIVAGVSLFVFTFPLYPIFRPLSFFIFMAIRIMFGIKGNKIYYAKYGKWTK